MTRIITIKKCHIYTLLWVCATIPTLYGILWTYDVYNDVVETGCIESGTYRYMICPSETDFDKNGNPYWAKQSNGDTVIYTDGKRLVKDYSANYFMFLIVIICIQIILLLIAYLGLNSHYKWFETQLESCERKEK